jgi:MFS family permease
MGFFLPDAYLPLLLQEWRGTPVTLTGFAFTATTLAWTAGAWLQARHIHRLGPAWFVVAGFGTVLAAIVLTIPVLASAVPPELAVATWGLAGLGMGLGYSALSVLVLREAPPAQVGSASAALQLSDVLGTALGTGIGGAMVAAGERVGPEGLGGALGAAFVLGAVITATGLTATRRLRPRPG